MDPPTSGLGTAIHDQARNRVELVAEVEANRPDGRLVAKPGTDGVPQIVQMELGAAGPHVSRVEKDHAAKLAPDDGSRLLRESKQAVAADGQSRAAQRADLIASPS